MPDDPAGPPQNSQHGNSRDYILRRLEAAGRHDLAAAVRAGRVSAFSVACQMGWSERPQNLGNGSRNQARRRRHQFAALADDAQKGSRLMELWLGPNPTGSLFNSREELEAAWHEHRDELMARHGSHGRRPMGWWEFAAEGLEYPGYSCERSYLYEAGVLSAAERDELEISWREAFDAAKGKGARERREAYEFADIPDQLVEKWTLERKRRSSLAKLSSAEGKEPNGRPTL